MDKNSQIEQVEIIKNQIDQALKEIEKIKNQTSTIRNAADLEQFEKTISKATGQTFQGSTTVALMICNYRELLGS